MLFQWKLNIVQEVHPSTEAKISTNTLHLWLSPSAQFIPDQLVLQYSISPNNSSESVVTLCFKGFCSNRVGALVGVVCTEFQGFIWFHCCRKVLININPMACFWSN